VRPGPLATRPRGIFAHPQGQASSMGVLGRAGPRPPTGEVMGRAGPLGRAAPPTGITPPRPEGFYLILIFPN